MNTKNSFDRTLIPAPHSLPAIKNSKDLFFAIGVFFSSLLLLFFSFKDGLQNMAVNWGQEEYSHGYMIPLVSLFLLARKIPDLCAIRATHNWLGVQVIAGGIALLFLGELSSLYTIIQYGFLVALTGIFISFIGMNGTIIIWSALVYLIFMVPLPDFLYFNLSSELQLISSTIGVTVIRWFNISVFLEGNVIDLGSYQLQVVEACNGLRYLFPLMSFGFLIAYLYKAPAWQRAIIFLSTVPITVLMNSFRIAVIGITVNYWGTAAAEGILHDFEGWVVFMACIGVLVFEIWLLNKISGNKGKISERLNMDLPDIFNSHSLMTPFSGASSKKVVTILSLVLIAIGLIAINSINTREEYVPERVKLNFLPLIKGGWVGREESLDYEIINELDVTDYLIANYTHKDGGLPVNFYIAYYESQRKGASVHSPRACIPGGGWRMTEFGTKDLSSYANFSPIDSKQALPPKINRAIISKGKDRSLVYYWFQQRGRIVTNEYLAKWYLFWDSLTMSRTDGALIRVVTNVPENMDIKEADEHLVKFLKEFNPLLTDYIPD